jgi:hypothetical protein
MPTQDEIVRFAVASKLTEASGLLDKTRALLQGAIAGLPFSTNQILRQNLTASLERLDRIFFDFPHDLTVLYTGRIDEAETEEADDRPPG